MFIPPVDFQSQCQGELKQFESLMEAHHLSKTLYLYVLKIISIICKCTVCICVYSKR